MAVQEAIQPPTRLRRLPRQTRFIVGIAVIFLAVAYLAVSSMSSMSTYYLTIGELNDQAAKVAGQPVRVSGKVIDSSIQRDSVNLVLRFTAYDEKDPSKTLPIVYKGVVPDTFKEGADVVVEGKLTSNGVFEAKTLFAKCPSKYEEAQAAGTPVPHKQ